MSSCIADVYTFTISLIGVILGVVYSIVIPMVDKEKLEIEDKLKEKIGKLEFKNCSKSVLLKDYEVTNKEIERRENITLVIGTIMVTASFLILSDSVSKAVIGTRFMSAFASIILYLLWLSVIHYTTKKLDRMSYARIHAIEERLDKEVNYGFGIHSFLYQETKKKYWIEVRRAFWGLTLILLSFCWLLASLLL